LRRSIAAIRWTYLVSQVRRQIRLKSMVQNGFDLAIAILASSNLSGLPTLNPQKFSGFGL
jgi:hypothetical protein